MQQFFQRNRGDRFSRITLAIFPEAFVRSRYVIRFASLIFYVFLGRIMNKYREAR